MPVTVEHDLAIRALYARSAQLFDRADPAWLNCWVDDLRFDFPPNPSAGFAGLVHTSKDELKVMLQRANEMTEGRGLHHFTNLTFDDRGDGVRVRGYMMWVKSDKGPQEPTAVLQDTRIDEEVVQVKGEWRFKRRSVGAIWS
jgi:SnoaL-like domain